MRGRQILCCTCHSHLEDNFIYGKEANIEHGPAPGYPFQEKAPWLASHHVSAMGLSSRTGSGTPALHTGVWDSLCAVRERTASKELTEVLLGLS